MRIGVIGSGVSGLTAAALLSQAQHRVTVYEQGEEIGGVTSGFQRDGYRWDLGPMLLNDFGPGEPARHEWTNPLPHAARPFKGCGS